MNRANDMKGIGGIYDNFHVRYTRIKNVSSSSDADIEKGVLKTESQVSGKMYVKNHIHKNKVKIPKKIVCLSGKKRKPEVSDDTLMDMGKFKKHISYKKTKTDVDCSEGSWKPSDDDIKGEKRKSDSSDIKHKKHIKDRF